MRALLLFGTLMLAAASLGSEAGSMNDARDAGPANPVKAATALAKRVLSERAAGFRFVQIPSDSGRDTFEITSKGGRIVIGGSNGVAMASGLNWYLQHCCSATYSVRGSQLHLPDPLPAPKEKVRQVSRYKYRYCFNYCTFGYTTAFWHWSDWQKLIDWMAMHGINAPLALTGQEAVWDIVYQKLGLTKKEVRDFLPGPAFFPWHFMGGLDSWGGPLPDSWMKSHIELQRRIVTRERELGMTPILQGFSGHVPQAIDRVYPDAKLTDLSWCGFPSTKMLDPQDPLFNKIGRMFIEEQTRLFGTSHLYAADTFNEITPPTNSPKWLGDTAKAVYDGMTSQDPDATWVMQGWIFVNAPPLWGQAQREAVFRAVPEGRLIMLDLDAGYRPVWGHTQAFSGTPWIWCTLYDFGGCVSLHTPLQTLTTELARTLSSPDKKQLVGLGMAMEHISYNPVHYDFMSDAIWRGGVPDMESWLPEWLHSRYGKDLPQAREAWKLLRETAYTQAERNDTAICSRPPGNGGWMYVGTPYDLSKLTSAWKMQLDCSPELKTVDTYRFDLANVGRQRLGALANQMRDDFVGAYQRKDLHAFNKSSAAFLELISDVDQLLGTRQDFLLGKWLEDARRWGTTDEERRKLAWNARAQITIWGIRQSGLNGYAHKEWSGMLNGFYKPRWESYIAVLQQSLDTGKPVDERKWDDDTWAWEESWCSRTDSYPTTPRGDTIEVSKRLWKKYEQILAAR